MLPICLFDEVGNLHWRCFASHNGGEFWLGFGETFESLCIEFARVCGKAKVDRYQQSELLQVVGEKIVDDLVRHVVQNFSLSLKSSVDLNPSRDLFENWSGACVIRTKICGQDAIFILNDLMRKVLVPIVSAEMPSNQSQHKSSMSAAKNSIADAIGEYKVDLNVRLSAVEIDIGTLEQLRTGDVIPLPHALSEPFRVFSAGGEYICDGFLGKVAEQKALELLIQDKL